jgi:hypothetical protein
MNIIYMYMYCVLGGLANPRKSSTQNAEFSGINLQVFFVLAAWHHPGTPRDNSCG